MSKKEGDNQLNDLLLKERRKLKVEMFPIALVEGFRKGKNLIAMVHSMIQSLVLL
jgi:hypothetical protein